MSTSRISYLKKIQDGMIFREQFEDSDFISHSGWVTMQGNPRNTTNKSKGGIWSLGMGGNRDLDGLPPVIVKSISDVNVEATLCSVWFYDDATKISLPGPFFKIKDGDDNFIQVGVRNSISTANYAAGGTSEDSFSDTGIARSTGWHLFQFVFQVGMFVGWAVKIDESYSVSFEGSSPIVKNIYLQGDVAENVSDSFGFFDEVHLCRSSAAEVIVGSSLLVCVNDRTGVPIDSDSFSTVDFPEPPDRFVTVADVFSPSVLNRTLIHRMTGGDKYRFVEIDFGRKVTAFDDAERSMLSINTSMGGQSEVLHWGMANSVTVSVNALETRETFAKLQDFYQYARLGGAFSVRVESGDSVAAFVAADAASSTNQLVLWTASFVPVSDFFSEGKTYVLENEAHTKRQLVKVVEIEDGNPDWDRALVTIEGRLNFDLRPGDTLRSMFFYPALCLENPASGNLDLVDPKRIRYNWSESFLEYVHP